ncbi:uncharacterized protein BT62DRAFT_997651 [Guyanagaster necrorhizus]|uniref:Uncharacterized protein n=1 Tax=Guyanagaster necrorhizus TaxID=856835 RepID=A0A9P7VHS2_9AGAR|nr:uncharacterized protein BT62DRAFT_997651 [Guyanagaster necrorhizus MCA 3950]KAG7440610.1 hypothetical protein BT62DRAFT_997651 [Guyanagaster necrorhizus MCA 3950]
MDHSYTPRKELALSQDSKNWAREAAKYGGFCVLTAKVNTTGTAVVFAHLIDKSLSSDTDARLLLVCLEYHNILDRNYAMFVPSQEAIKTIHDFTLLPNAEKRKKPAKMYFDYKEKSIQVQSFSLKLSKEYMVSCWTLQQSEEEYKQTQERTDVFYPFHQPELRNQLQSHVSPFCPGWNAGRKLAKYDDNALDLLSTSAQDQFDFRRLVGFSTTWNDDSTVPVDFLNGTRSTFFPIGSIQFPSESEEDGRELQIKSITKRQRTSRRGTSSAVNGPPTTTNDAPSPSERAARRTRSKKTASSIAGLSLGQTGR